MAEANSLDSLLRRLEENKAHFSRGTAAQTVKLLASLSRRRFPDAESLIRFHEALLFCRAFPQSPQIVTRVEKLLNEFSQRFEEFHARAADLSDFDQFETAGIAGTTMQDTLSFDVVRWLLRRIPENIEINWEGYEDERALGETWPRFFPLLREDSEIEPNIPWRDWLRAARGKTRELEYLVRRFEQLPLPERAKSELYGSLRLPVRWRLNHLRLSRTRNWHRPRSFYYHREPLIARSQVSLAEEFGRPPLVLTKVRLRKGEEIVEMAREAMVVRYRELYGTTFADARSVVCAEVGRGVQIYLWNLPPDRRLPLRAYVAGFTLKNGVPIHYMEATGLCEWLEVGFNAFYTFRQGETAWIYAQSLRALCAMTGAKCLSVYPYQIGQNNDEAIASGAFWFYRKLGFRPGRADLVKLAEREESKIAARPGYRTPPRTLKRFAEAHMFYELSAESGDWEQFSTRALGIRVNRRMAREFGGDIAAIGQASVRSISRALGIPAARWSEAERRALENWALVLAEIPQLDRWVSSEKKRLVQIIRAKAARDEMKYLRLLQAHPRLRGELLRKGKPG
jgi:hypothetical protein